MRTISSHGGSINAQNGCGRICWRCRRYVTPSNRSPAPNGHNAFQRRSRYTATANTIQNGIVDGEWYSNPTVAAAQADIRRPCISNPLASNTAATAKPLGTGSYSTDNTAGPTMVAPNP